MPAKQIIRALALCCLAATFTGCSSLLFQPTRHLHMDPEAAGYKPEEIFFPSEDGTRLFAWYFRHTGSAPAKGVLVHFHGNAENLSSHFLNVLWILRHGYDFFIFDYRGYGRSEGEAVSVGSAVADGRAALRYVQARNPKLPIIVLGQSLGGALAARAVFDLKDEVRPRLLALDSTFHSYKSIASEVLSRNWFTWPFQWLSYIVLSDKYAPEDVLAKLAPIPVLVIHGDADRVVDYPFGQKVFALASEPKEFWQISGGGHTDVFLREGGRYQRAFLKKLGEVVK